MATRFSTGRRTTALVAAVTLRSETTGLRRRSGALLAACALACAAIVAPGLAGAQDDGAPKGTFSEPFVEPTIDGQPSEEKCKPKDEQQQNGREFECKPTAGSINVLLGGTTFYWDALEGTENVNNSIVAEYGAAAENDESRLLDLNNGDPQWEQPPQSDGGANPDGNPNSQPLIPGAESEERGNDGALFCSDNNFLADGRIIANGGTAYLNDPAAPNAGVGIPGATDQPIGAVELEGVDATRIFDPATKQWSQAGRMMRGRWYPTMVTLGNGKILTASGVEKLLKPVYQDRLTESGMNVKQTETFDPADGQWDYNGESADRSLPLYPRLNLLPNGHVFYGAAGQPFNPAGEAYDQPLWNIAASYDPAAKSWKDLGIPGGPTTGVTTFPGFRGSATQTMMPLVPDEGGNYSKTTFLSAGGVSGGVAATSPGAYIALPQSQLATVDTTDGNKLTTEETGPLSKGRWYGTQVLLPTGEVAIFSGSDRDEVVAPGVEIPVKEVEIYDPEAKEWKVDATANKARTYHNTAVLLPDGRVLVGGHAPISTLYGSNMTVADGFGPNDGRDPTFEIYSPPNLSRGDRPVITNVSRPEKSTNNRVRVALPENDNVLPAGPYMLFANKKTSHGKVPSISAPVMITDGSASGAKAARAAARTAKASGSTKATASQADGNTTVVSRSGELQIEIEGDPEAIEDVALVRNPSLTHLVDGDQRSVQLPITARAAQATDDTGDEDDQPVADDDSADSGAGGSANDGSTGSAGASDVVAAGSGSGDDDLAFTGLTLWPLAVLGLALLGTGGFLAHRMMRSARRSDG
ncbi:MAG: galactose oxidase [Solirubrobacterales bacterium]